jgi:hypothetical protein
MKKLTAGDITPIMMVCMRNKGLQAISKLSEIADAVVEYYLKRQGVSLYDSLGIYTATNQPLITRYTFEALSWAKKMNFVISLGRDQYQITGAGELFSYGAEFHMLLNKSLEKLDLITGNIISYRSDDAAPVQQQEEAMPEVVTVVQARPSGDIVFPRGQEKAYLMMIQSAQCFGSFLESDSACKACFLSSVCKEASHG